MQSSATRNAACLTFRDLNSNAVYNVALESGVFVAAGQDENAAIRLTSIYVDQIQCLIGLTGGKLYVKHMEAVNGTYLYRGTETTKVEDYAEITEGDILILADVQLRLESVQ